MKGLFTWQQLQTIEREAPERIEVPSGSRIALHYEPGRPPILAVRIQEVFGLLETPRIAGGRVPVLMHLLAPNMRVAQVTDDLASFWANTYALVRKDLRARYPKHSWPEDPYTALPSGGRREGRVEYQPTRKRGSRVRPTPSLARRVSVITPAPARARGHRRARADAARARLPTIPLRRAAAARGTPGAPSSG